MLPLTYFAFLFPRSLVPGPTRSTGDRDPLLSVTRKIAQKKPNSTKTNPFLKGEGRGMQTVNGLTSLKSVL